MVASPFDHLHPDIRHLATADRQARKTCIETDRWISYPAGEDAIERLFELVDMPPRIRMPSILFWASPNMGNPKTSPLGPHWLTLRYRHSKIQGWQSVFTHAVPDLLFLLVMELPRHAVQELNERSMAWPADLRRRWIYAVAVGAVGGFVW